MELLALLLMHEQRTVQIKMQTMLKNKCFQHGAVRYCKKVLGVFLQTTYFLRCTWPSSTGASFWAIYWIGHTSKFFVQNMFLK